MSAGIRLHIRFDVDAEHAAGFERLVRSSYLPALARRPGFADARLLRAYPPAALAEIGGADGGFGYVLEFGFATEAARLAWAASAEHDPLWAAAEALSRRQSWCGYDDVTNDEEETR